MFEGNSELAYQVSQLAIGIRGDVAGLIGLHYCDPVVGASQHALRVIQTRVWKRSGNHLDVSLVQDLRDDAYVCVGKLRKESGPWSVALNK
jgi:hypothetical protein